MKEYFTARRLLDGNRHTPYHGPIVFADRALASESGASSLREMLRGGLVASCQPVRGGRFDEPCFVEAFALAALDEGAVAVRIEGPRDLAWLRPRTRTLIVGLVKRRTADPDVFITPEPDDARVIVDHGADIVAFDATDGSLGSDRAKHVAGMIEYVQSYGRAVMADISTLGEGLRAARLGADLVATTLAGYTALTTGRPLPDLALVGSLAERGVPVVAEGALSEPGHVAEAFKVGALAVTVGTGFSRPELLIRRFLAVTPRECHGR